MNSLRLSLLLAFFAPLAACAQADPLINQILRIEPGHNNRLTNRTYGLGHATGLSADQALSVVALYGTPQQRRRTRRLERTSLVLQGSVLAGLPLMLSGGFFGPSQLALRQGLVVSGAGAFGAPLVGFFPLERRSHKMVQAYTDSLLARHHYRVPSVPLAWTLADTLHIGRDGQTYYRNVPIDPFVQLPNRASFSWTDRPRMPVIGGLAIGLATVGSILLSYSSLGATGPDGDFRRTAWFGAGLMVSGFSVAFIGRKRTKRHLLNEVKRHNEQLIENDQRYFQDVTAR